MTTPNSGATSPRALPARPNLEYLKNEAKRRLDDARAATPGLQLSDVQFQLAREYGFASWRDLKARIEGGSAAGPDPVGDWIAAFTSAVSSALHIRRADTGKLRATFDVPTQGYFDDSVDDLTVEDGRLAFTITARGVNALYEATWDAGAEAWSGVWTQNGVGAPLSFVRGTLPPAPALEGLDGLWDGILAAKAPVRLTFRIRTDERGTQASLESSNQDGVWHRARAITREGAEVQVRMQTLSVRGTLSDDGARIEGEWRRGETVLPITLVRRAPGTAAPRISTPPEITLPVEALTEYAGVYGVDDGPQVTLAVEDGRLWTLNLAGLRGLELVPFEPDAFFTRQTDGTLTFARDAEGAIAAFVLRNHSGRDLRARRIG